MSNSTAVNVARACPACAKPEHGSVACEVADDWQAEPNILPTLDPWKAITDEASKHRDFGPAYRGANLLDEILEWLSTRDALQPPAAVPNEDVSRGRFEAFMRAPPYEHDCARSGPESAWPGQYKRYETQLAWDVWRAAAVLQPPPQEIERLRGLFREATSDSGIVLTLGEDLHERIRAELDKGDQ